MRTLAKVSLPFAQSAVHSPSSAEIVVELRLRSGASLPFITVFAPRLEHSRDKKKRIDSCLDGQIDFSRTKFRRRPVLMKCPRVQLLLATVIASAGLLGCGGEKEKPAPPPPGVTIAPVIQQDVPIRQEVVGTMLGNVDADIRPKVEGFLLSRVYAEGQLVAKGQVMYQLDR